MPVDAHKNLAVSTVAVAPSPATSGTALTVWAGEGARFPTVPFNATVCPTTVLATPANAEIVRVTARVGDGFTMTRAQEGTTARAIVVGDVIAATITAKTLTDIETLPFAYTNVNNIFTAPQQRIQSAQPQLELYDATAVADARLWIMKNGTTRLLFAPLLDSTGGTGVTPLQLERAGDVWVGRDLYEKGRTAPMGHWIDVPFDAANFTANSGSWTVTAGQASTYSYALVGKTATIAWYLASTTIVGTPTQLLVRLPGVVFAKTQGQPMHYFSGAAGTGFCYVTPGTSQVVIVRDFLQPAWVAGATHIVGTASFAIQ